MSEPIAVLDLGSARAKLLVGRIGTNGEVETIEKQKAEFSIIKHHNAHNGLDAGAMKELIDALRPLVQGSRATGATQIVAIATEALRKTSNREEVIRALSDELGCAFNILTPELEADILFAGVNHDGMESYAVADIGGGSVQLAWARGSSISIPTGTFVLEKDFHTLETVPTEQTYQNMHTFIAENLSRTLQGQNVHAKTLIVGTSCMRDFFDSAMRVGEVVEQPKKIYSRDEIDKLFSKIAGQPYDDVIRYYPEGGKFMYGGDKLLVNVQELMSAIQATEALPTNDSTGSSLIRLASQPDGLQRLGLKASPLT